MPSPNVQEQEYIKLLALLCCDDNKPANFAFFDKTSQNVDIARLYQLATEHGVTGLLNCRSKTAPQVLDEFFIKVGNYNKHVVIATQFIDSEAKSLLQTLNESGLAYVVLKGFALARSVYTEISSRTKSDIDILVANKDFERVKSLFEKQGYVNPRGWEPVTISNEISMSKQIGRGIDVLFDVHVKITNNKVTQELLSFDELYQNAFQSNQCTLVNRPYALVHAIIHLVNHRTAGDLIKLIWFYDIYLLIERFSTFELQQFRQLVVSKGIVNLTLTCLHLTAELFKSTKLEDMIHWCNQDGILSSANDAFDVLLESTKGIAGVWLTLKYTSGLLNKWNVIQEMAFPPKEEIYIKYGVNNPQPLVLLYIRRFIGGIYKYLHSK